MLGLRHSLGWHVLVSQSACPLLASLFGLRLGVLPKGSTSEAKTPAQPSPAHCPCQLVEVGANGSGAGPWGCSARCCSEPCALGAGTEQVVGDEVTPDGQATPSVHSVDTVGCLSPPWGRPGTQHSPSFSLHTPSHLPPWTFCTRFLPSTLCPPYLTWWTPSPAAELSLRITSTTFPHCLGAPATSLFGRWCETKECWLDGCVRRAAQALPVCPCILTGTCCAEPSPRRPWGASRIPDLFPVPSCLGFS